MSLANQQNTTAASSPNAGELFRSTREIEGVSEKTVMFTVAYLCPKALARYARAMDRQQALQMHSTRSFCKNEPVFADRAQAQKRADERNAEAVGAFATMTYFHVIEVFAVPVTPHQPLDMKRIERELAEDFETDRQLLGRAAAEESDAFARRVMGLD